MSSILQDLRFSLRILRRFPAVTATKILTLGLGIGVCTTMLSVVSGLMLRTLPFDSPASLVSLWEAHPQQSGDFRVASEAVAAVWAEELDELSDLALSRTWHPIVSHDNELQRLRGAKVSAEFLPLLGIEPLLGRAFSVDDERPGAAPVVLLSHDLWQRQFGGDPDLLGRTIALEGGTVTASATVIGILPPETRLAEPVLPEPAEILAPIALPNEGTDFGQRYLRVIGRLAEGTELKAARSHLAAISRTLAQLHPESNEGWTARIELASEQLVAPIRPALLALSAAVAFVLLVSCCNAGILQLSQASMREQELAIRLALGAQPLRVGRQVFTECVLTLLASALLGSLLAQQGLALVATRVASQMPLGGELTLDPWMLLLTIAAAATPLTLFSLLPAARAAGADGYLALRESGRGARTGGQRGGRARRALVLAEIALSLVLLIGATLMVRSFQRLAAADPGFEAHGVLTLGLHLPRSLHPDSQRLDGLYKTLLGDLEQLPQVEALALIDRLPMQGATMATEAADEATPEERIKVEFHGVSEGYFQTLQIPLIAGRDLSTRHDEAAARNEVVLSAAAAEALFPGQSAIGRGVIVDWQTSTPREVVGVVGDVRHHGIRSQARPTVYMPLRQVSQHATTLVVRTDSDRQVVANVRSRARELETSFVIEAIRDLDDVVAQTIAGTQGQATLTTVFALIALALAMGGIYSVVTHSVAQRRYDFSVRQALGALPRQLVRATVVEALRQATVGLGLGLLAALLLTRTLSGLFYGISAHDPWTLIANTLTMAGVIVIATYVPARRAMRIDPAADLRAG
ncbi:MAG: ADOP family duplicated permease [Acidobacteriota bacterium]